MVCLQSRRLLQYYMSKTIRFCGRDAKKNQKQNNRYSKPYYCYSNNIPPAIQSTKVESGRDFDVLQKKKNATIARRSFLKNYLGKRLKNV